MFWNANWSSRAKQLQSFPIYIQLCPASSLQQATLQPTTNRPTIPSFSDSSTRPFRLTPRQDLGQPSQPLGLPTLPEHTARARITPPSRNSLPQACPIRGRWFVGTDEAEVVRGILGTGFSARGYRFTPRAMAGETHRGNSSWGGKAMP